MPKIMEFINQAEWLDYRHQDVTSTEAAALFGLSPYLTHFELYHRKRAPLDQQSEHQQTERMKWGNRLEPVIAEGVASDEGWTVKPFKVYARHDTQPRMGSSFDYEIVEATEDSAAWPIYGPGILEIKNVDGLVFRGDWVDVDGELEAPAHIEIQVQHQLEVADREWAAIVALVGGNTPQILYRSRDRVVGAVIRGKIQQFWNDVAAGVEPAPDFARDARFIAQLYGFAEPGKVLEPGEGEARQHLIELLEQYHRLGAEGKRLDEEREGVRAQLLMLVGDAERVIVPGFSVSAGVVAECEMHYTRKAYRNFRVTAKKAKVLK